MKTNTVGYKQLVKSGEITAKDALTRLVAKADLNGGAVGVKLLKQTQTYRWLHRRFKAGK